MHEALTTSMRSPERSERNAFEERPRGDCRSIANLDRGRGAGAFSRFRWRRVLLKTTLSLCEVCLAHVPAAVYEVDGRVLSSSRCVDHGVRVALMENDARYYRLSSKDQWGPSLPGTPRCWRCRPSVRAAARPPVVRAVRADRANRVTNPGSTISLTSVPTRPARCWLRSPMPAISPAECVTRIPAATAWLPLERFKVHIERLIEQSGALESVQITGGKPLCTRSSGKCSRGCTRATGCAKIYLPTNGIELSKTRRGKETSTVSRQAAGAAAVRRRRLRHQPGLASIPAPAGTTTADPRTQPKWHCDAAHHGAGSGHQRARDCMGGSPGTEAPQRATNRHAAGVLLRPLRVAE